MCVVCVLWEKGKISTKEASKALDEIVETERDASEVDWEHIWDLAERIDNELAKT